MEIQSLGALQMAGAGPSSSKHLKVCIVSSEFIGPVKNGGIGTATSALAQHLVRDGHKVTLLYTYVGHGKPVTGDKPWGHWVESLLREGIVLEYLPHKGDYRAWREASWLVKDFLGQRDFDLIYFNDHFGSGYYSLLAKKAGLAPFVNQLHCLITHGSMEWVFNINDHYSRRITDLEWMGLERRSVEMADIVIAPARYLLEEYKSYGWSLPRQTFHQPYPVFRNPVNVDPALRLPVAELVFFGRLEVRKGLWLFCEALDALSERFPKIDVTFLGRDTEFSGISSALQILKRSARWPYRIRLLLDFDQKEALAYLCNPGRLAVMPSIADNSPNAVYECLESAIPFISTRGSGIDELVHESCWSEMLVQPDVASLVTKLELVLRNGTVLGRPRFDPKNNLETWSAWHSFVAENLGDLISKPSEPVTAPPKEKKAALIVVLDDGECALSLLIENLCSHVRRFSENAGYLILSTRRGELQDIIVGLFDRPKEIQSPPICIFDGGMAGEARRLISAAEYAIFVDSHTEIQTSFFVRALESLMNDDRCVTSCAVAVRKSRDEVGDIQDLPTGNIPGLAALGESIGSSVWGLTAAKLQSELSSIEIFDQQLERFRSSWALGQLVMQKCQACAIPVNIMPMVGGVETNEHGQTKQLTFKDSSEYAKALGITPSICNGGPAWFSISAFGGHVRNQNETYLDLSEFLSPKHPYFTLKHSLEAGDQHDLPLFAAALGRGELSMQLETAQGPGAGRLRHLADVATRSMRLRPVWDLLEVLNEGKHFYFGSSPLPGPLHRRNKVISEGARRQIDKSSNHGLKRLREIGCLYADGRRLRIRKNVIECIVSARSGGPAKFYIFDIPLLGHSTFIGRFCSAASAEPLFLRMKMFEQRDGDQIAMTSRRLDPGRSTEFTMPLNEVFTTATLVFELSGAAKMEVTVETLQIR